MGKTKLSRNNYKELIEFIGIKACSKELNDLLNSYFEDFKALAEIIESNEDKFVNTEFDAAIDILNSHIVSGDIVISSNTNISNDCPKRMRGISSIRLTPTGSTTRSAEAQPTPKPIINEKEEPIVPAPIIDEKDPIFLKLKLPSNKIYIYTEAIGLFGKNFKKQQLIDYGLNRFSRELIYKYPNSFRMTEIKNVLNNIAAYNESVDH